MKQRIILASRSPRRQLLLRQIGLTFTARPSRIDETIRRGQTPGQNVKRIALEKARDVASRTKLGIVVGADTIVVLGTRILGKPGSRAEARRMLRSLSGKAHYVYTGFSIIDASTGKTHSEVVRTKVWFRRLTGKEIDQYVASGSPLDKAGAYGIQDDFGAVFVERINGCFYNVVGFPLVRFYRALRRFGKDFQ
ncbi:MAG: Maf family protein [Bacteroidota bacterium]